MEKETFGRIVRVRRKYLSGPGYADEIWYAAIDDDAQAIAAVSKATQKHDEIVEVVGQLAPGVTSALGIPPQQVRVFA